MLAHAAGRWAGARSWGHGAGSGRAEKGRPGGWAAPGLARAHGSRVGVVGPAGPARARAVTSVATAPGPGGQHRGNTALRRSGRAPWPRRRRERAEPRSVSPKGGEGPRAEARPRCHGDTPRTHHCSAALSPRRETKAALGRPGFIAQGSPRGQSGAAHGTRRRSAKAVETRARTTPLWRRSARQAAHA